MKMRLITVAILALCANPASAWEVYGGATTGTQQLNYGPMSGNPQDMDPGFAVGVGQYWPGPQNWSFGADLMLTDQDYETWGPGANLSTLSVMGVARYTFASPPSMQPYVAGGLGGINVSYSQSTAPFLDGSETIAGYQIEAGMRFQLPTYTAFGGLKYQAGFDQAFIQTEYVEYNSLALIAGVAF